MTPISGRPQDRFTEMLDAYREAFICLTLRLERPVRVHLACADVFTRHGRPGCVMQLFTCGGNTATFVSWQ